MKLEIPPNQDVGGKFNGLDFMQRHDDAEKILSFLKPEHTVFEFGCGASTLFYSQCVKKFVSVEFDKHWHDVVKAKAQPNVEMILAPQNIPFDKFPTATEIEAVKKEFSFPSRTFPISKPYFAGTIKDWPVIQYLRVKDYVDACLLQNRKYDVVFVDGRAVVFSVIQAIKCLAENGVIIVQNFWFRKEYGPIIDYCKYVDCVRPPKGDMVVLKPK